jgi:hypothetical protein
MTAVRLSSALATSTLPGAGKRTRVALAADLDGNPSNEGMEGLRTLP